MACQLCSLRHGSLHGPRAVGMASVLFTRYADYRQASLPAPDCESPALISQAWRVRLQPHPHRSSLGYVMYRMRNNDKLCIAVLHSCQTPVLVVAGATY